MAKYETNSLGYPLKFNGPDTVEQYDQKSGKVGACLQDAVDNTIYRGTLPEWQDAFAKRITDLTGVVRNVNTDATAAAKARSKTPEKVKDIMETVRVFHNRAVANATDEVKKALATAAQAEADKIEIDPSPSKRAAGLEKGYKDKAESWLTLPTDQLETKITKALDKVEGYELARDEENKPTVESLGRLIKLYVEALLADEL